MQDFDVSCDACDIYHVCTAPVPDFLYFDQWNSVY